MVQASTTLCAFDKRQVLKITWLQRGHVIKEMGALLSGTQNILAALSNDDMAAVAEYARSLGMGMTVKAEDHLQGALPKDFMSLGISVYHDFEKIAADAQSNKDPKHTLQQLSQAMSKCVACDATYQMRTAKNIQNLPISPSTLNTNILHYYANRIA